MGGTIYSKCRTNTIKNIALAISIAHNNKFLLYFGILSNYSFAWRFTIFRNVSQFFTFCIIIVVVAHIYPPVTRERQTLAIGWSAYFSFQWLLRDWRNPHLIRSFQWFNFPVDFFEFLSTEFAICLKPTSWVGSNQRLQKLVFTASLLDVQQFNAQCEASTVRGRQADRWHLDSKTERFLRCLLVKATWWWIKCTFNYNYKQRESLQSVFSKDATTWPGCGLKPNQLIRAST